jgi:hypothetical protein
MTVRAASWDPPPPRSTRSRRRRHRHRSRPCALLLLVLLSTVVFPLLQSSSDLSAYLPTLGGDIFQFVPTTATKNNENGPAATTTSSTRRIHGDNNERHNVPSNTTTTVSQEFEYRQQDEKTSPTPKIKILESTNNQSKLQFDHRFHQGEKNATTTISSKTTATTPPVGNLWLCGWQQEHLSRHHLFPDYKFAGTYHHSTKSTRKDVLVVGMFGPCDIPKSRLGKHFGGTILYVNGEPYGSSISADDDGERVYQIGYGPPPPPPPPPPPIVSNNSSSIDESSLLLVSTDHHHHHHHHIRGIYYISIILMNRFTDQLDLLVDPSQRPQWNGRESKIIYVASKCFPHRQAAAALLSTVVPLVTGGKCTIVPNNTNTVRTTLPSSSRGSWGNNWKIYADYKYCLLLENHALPGYITEKLLFGYLGGCLPIYYGTREVFNIFNADSFVFWDVENPHTAMQQIAFLEGNATAYEDMKRAPILKNGTQTINDYFSFSDDDTATTTVGDGSLKRKIRSRMGLLPNR